MAITLHTGLPGNAKTLFTIRHVVDWAASEDRPVYFAGIKGLLVDDPRLKGTQWIPFDPLTWHENVPSGSIIVIDEAQKIFRSRSSSASPLKHVTELEEHRHKGLDFVLITQHPSLVDTAVRRLTQTHRHLVRIWGAPATTVHRWDAVRDNCDKPSARKDSEASKWVFDKSLYGVYHSADVHTMKFRVPGRVKLLLALPVVLFCLGYFAYSKLNKVASSADDVAAVVHSAAPVGVVVPPSPAGRAGGAGAGAGAVPLAVSDPLADAKSYVAMRTPRLEGLPETAPRYDALTVPVRVPVPAMCVQIGPDHDGGKVRCVCYTQQATRMDVPFAMCVELAHGGRFLDFDPEPRAQSARSDESARVGSAGRAQLPLPSLAAAQ